VRSNRTNIRTSRMLGINEDAAPAKNRMQPGSLERVGRSSALCHDRSIHQPSFTRCVRLEDVSLVTGVITNEQYSDP
jgi:hypothetical protein